MFEPSSACRFALAQRLAVKCAHCILDIDICGVKEPVFVEKSMADKSLPLAGQCDITTDAEIALDAFSVEPTRSPPIVTRPQ